MASIRNSSLIKRFTDFFKLKIGDGLDNEVTPLIVPTVNQPLPAKIFVAIDTAVNDSDKTITVPVGKQWKLLYGRITLITTATVGDRRMRLLIEDDSGNDLYIIDALNVQTASTTEGYVLGQFGDVGEALATFHTFPIPTNLILPENFTIRIFDSVVVDAAADDMTLFLVVDEIDVTGEGI